MDESTIGTRLRTLRRWRGMTLAELAGLAGVSAGFLSMAERGLRTLGPAVPHRRFGRRAAGLEE